MDSKYSEKQLYLNYPDGIENHYWNLSRNKILYDTLKKHNLVNQKILEIGCGRGIVVQYLNDLNINCYGVDTAEGKPIRENGNVILGKNCTDLKQEFRESIDVIMLLDVIEHIQEPKSFLSEIKNAFPNALHFIITVPARKEIWSNYDEFYGHFRRYSKKLLKSDTSILKGKFVSIRYLYNALYYPAFLIKALGLKRNVYLKAPLGAKQILLNRIICSLFYLEFKIRIGSYIGTSLLTTIRIS